MKNNFIFFFSLSVLMSVLFMNCPVNSTGEKAGGGTNPIPQIPIMKVIMNSAEITNNAVDFDLGQSQKDTAKDFSFTIENSGEALLQLSGSPIVELSGDTQFILKTDATADIPAKSSITFVITFTPEDTITYHAAISIANNTSAANPFTFSITATGTQSEINIKNVTLGNINVNDDTTDDIGQTSLNTPLDIIYKIENLGTGDLVLKDNPCVSLSGNSAFSLNFDAVSPIAASGYATFTIRFNPATRGTFQTIASIANNDADEDPYNFVITAQGTGPAISVKENSIVIANGTSNYDVGEQFINSSKHITFTIVNDGEKNLTLSDSPCVTLTGDSAFSLQADAATPVTSSGGTTTFIIAFTPATTDAVTGTISIANNDSANSPYTFSITGKGKGPEINVRDYTNGDITIDNESNIDIGPSTVNTAKDITFYIDNLGIADLLLTHTPTIIDLSGDTVFTLKTDASSPVSASGNTSFIITFLPTAKTAYSAKVTITNNDSDENPFVFTIYGEGTAPDMAVLFDSTTLSDGTANYDIGTLSTPAGTPKDFTFTIRNTGNEDLVLTQDGLLKYVTLTGTGFSLKTDATTPITGSGGTTAFVVTFTPVDANVVYTGSISIINNDPAINKNPYNFTFTSTASGPEMNVYDVTNGNALLADGTTNHTISSGGSKVVTFRIENTGTETLYLSSTPRITLSGADVAQFTLTTDAAADIPAGSSSTFVITFTSPGTGGPWFYCDMTINNNDNDKNPYTIGIRGKR